MMSGEWRYVMFCPHCGTQLPDGSRFCGACGAQLPAATPESMAPQPGAAPQPIEPPAPQSVYDAPPTFDASSPQGGSKPKTALIVAAVVAAIAVVALLVFGLTRCTSAGSSGSPQDVANRLDGALETMIDGDFSSESLTSGIDQMIDIMPPEAVEKALERDGMTREDLRDDMESALGVMDEYSAYLGMVNIEFEVTVGAPLSADDLEDINDSLADAGVSSSASEAYQISLYMEVSALGQSYEQDLDESGMCAVHLGSGWYLWGSDNFGL